MGERLAGASRAARGAAARLPNPGQSDRRAVRAAWKLIVLVVGLTVAAAGVAMLVLPGPGIVVIILGLAILASEFVWARALLERAKAQAEKAKTKATDRLARRKAGAS